MPPPKDLELQEHQLDELHKQTYAVPPVEDVPPAAPSTPAAASAPPAEPATPEPVTPPPAAPAISEDTWEARYKVLNGKYIAEVPRLQEELKTLRTEFQKLKSAPPPERLLKPEEIEKFGPEFMDMVQRAARETFGPVQRQLESEVASLKSQLEGKVEADNNASASAFFEQLTRIHPDWEAVNQNPEFLKWLAGYDPKARTIRQQLLDDAVRSRDAQYVADLLTEWKALTVKPASRRPPASPEPATLRSNEQPPLPKKVWTRAEIKGVYDNYRNGTMTKADYDKAEQEIHEAQLEGRIK